MIVFHWLVCGGLSLAGLWWSLFGWAVVVSLWLGCGGLSLAGLWWSLIGWSVAGQGETLPS